jgi:glycosyltransferase involved in cell wall biosynthesis
MMNKSHRNDCVKINVIHCIVNNLGGITSLAQNLIIYNVDQSVNQQLLTLNITDNKNEPAQIESSIVKKIEKFIVNPKYNWYHTYSQLAISLSNNSGVLISNDQFDLIMLQAFNIPRKVVQLVHDSYNLELSKKFHFVIDGFIAHNKNIYNQLINLFPERKNDIHFQPYGIPFVEERIHSKVKNKELKLLFIGRHDTGKGIFDLFEINTQLLAKNLSVEWYILGKGPETERLKNQWSSQHNVTFVLARDNDEVLNFALNCDILVFPTKFEGSPVAMLEAMSMGCVPVVTELPGGIEETIQNGVNGFKCKLDQIDDFVIAIEILNSNRDLLYEMQTKCHSTVLANFNIYKNTSSYIKIFKNYAKSSVAPRHHRFSLKIGSRLDQRWIPNIITRDLRSNKIRFFSMNKLTLYFYLFFATFLPLL